MHRKAIELGSELACQFPAIRKYHLLVMEDCRSMSWILALQAQAKEGLASCRVAAEVGEQLVRTFPAEPQYRRALIKMLDRWAWLSTIAGEYAEAERIGRLSLSHAEKLAADYPTDPDYRVDFGEKWCNLGNYLNRFPTSAGKSAEARRCVEQAILHLRDVYQAAPNHAKCRECLAFSYQILGSILSKAGEYRAALGAFEDAILLDQRDDSQESAAWLLLTCPDARVRDFRRALDLAREAVKREPQEGINWCTLALARYRLGDWAEAIAAAMQVVQIGSHPAKKYTQIALGEAWLVLAMAHHRRGDHEQAQACYNHAARWNEETKLGNGEFQSLRAEARDLLGVGMSAQVAQPPAGQQRRP